MYIHCLIYYFKFDIEHILHNLDLWNLYWDYDIPRNGAKFVFMKLQTQDRQYFLIPNCEVCLSSQN